MELRRAKPQDRAFLVEMARLACTLEDRPLPARGASEVLALLPAPDAAIVATDDDGQPLGAAWWHLHEPPLLRDATGEPVPELVMAVVEGERRKGLGAALVDALAEEEAAKHFSVLALNSTFALSARGDFPCLLDLGDFLAVGGAQPTR